jgi:hypothetical protein
LSERPQSNAQVPQAVGPVAGHFQVDRQIAADLFGALVIQPGHHQPAFQLGGRHVEQHVFFQPVPGDDHGNT